VALLVAGCGGGGGSSSTTSSSSQTPADFDFGGNDSRKVSAFGDSITQGVLELRRRDLGLTTRNNYPALLQGKLQSFDPAWRVVNRGVGGEETNQGIRRLSSVLAIDRPGFVLILEGSNDAHECLPIDGLANNLMNMARTVRANHSIPVLGTIPPSFRNDPCADNIIDQVNAQIRAFAQAEQVVLAEIFNGMNDRSLFGLAPNRDPLHPNEAGYAVMSDIWLSALLEAAPGGVLAAAQQRRRR
jgi:lysophospholipase L1-like esterase